MNRTAESILQDELTGKINPLQCPGSEPSKTTIEYLRVEGTHKGHLVQLLAPHRTT